MHPTNISIKGDTLLHQCVRGCTNLKDINNLIAKLGNHSAEKMARTCNDEGYLPFQLVQFCKLNATEKEALFMLLINLATEHKYIPFREKLQPIKLNKILQKYSVPPGSLMQKYFIIAYNLINIVRQVLEKSSTHPETNDFTHEEKLKLQNEISIMRNEVDSNLCRFNNIFKFYKNNRENIINNIVQSARKFKRGNCYECPHLAYQVLKSMDNTIPAKVWTLLGGDHGVLVLGDSPNEVVCDTLLAKVYPFSQYEKKLKAHCYDQNTMRNIYVFYNSNIYKLVPYNQEDKVQFVMKNHLINMGKLYMLLLISFLLAYFISLHNFFNNNEHTDAEYPFRNKGVL